MFDRRFDPRSAACGAYAAFEPHNDPSLPLVAKTTYPVDVGVAWRWAICLAVAVCVFIVSTPAAAQAGGLIVAGLAALGITGLTTATGGLTTTGLILAAVINGVLGAALSYGLSALTAPDQPTRPGSIDALRNIYRGTKEPAVVVYGETVLSGLLCEARSVNEDGEPEKGDIMHVCLAICRGPIEAVDQITLNDEPSTALKFRNRALFIPQLGFTDQPPLHPGPYNVKGEVLLPKSWTEKNRTLAGTAYAWGILRHAPEVFPSGAPGIRFRVRGKLCWDPREDVAEGGTQRFGDETTWRYTNNPVVCTLDYLTNTLYGRGVPLDLFDLDEWIAAANECDETITVTEKREKVAGQPDTEDVEVELPKYRCDGAFLTDSRPDDILRSLVTCFGGAVFPYGGKWRVTVGAARPAEIWPDEAPVPAALRGEPIVLDETHLRDGEDFEFVTAPGRKEKINTVVPIFFDPDKDFQKSPAPKVSFDEFIAEDGGEFARDVELPFVANVHRARYLARQLLIRNRAGQRIRYPAVPSMLLIPPTGRVKLTNELYGLEAKDYTVEAIDIDPVNRTPTLSLREYSTTEFDAPDDPVILPPRTTLPDPLVPPDKPSLVTVVEALHTNPDQSRASKLLVTITPPAESLIDGYLIEWRKSGEAYNASRVAVLPTSRTQYDIIGLEEGVYEVRVRTTFGFLRSQPYIVGARITYRTTPPPTPNVLRVAFDPVAGLWEYTAQAGLLSVRAPDVTHFEFRYIEATTADPLGVDVEAEWDRASVLGRVEVVHSGIFTRGTLRTLTPVKPASYAVYVKTLDTTGLYSTGTAWTRIVAQPASSDVLYRREYSEGGWTAPEYNQCGLTDDGLNRGEIIDGRVADDGSLIAKTQGTFGDIQGETVPWSELQSSRIVYVSPIIDLCADHVVGFDYDVRADGGTRYRVEFRSRGNDDQEWTPFRSRYSSRARWAQFRLSARATNALARIYSFSVAVRDKLDRETIDDFDMAARVGRTLFEPIIDDGPEDWNSGTHLGTDATLTGLELDDDAAAALDGSTTITAPDADVLDLTANSWTIEFEIGFDTDAYSQEDVVVIGKGTAWQVLWNDSGGLEYFSLKSTGYSGDNPQLFFFRPDPALDPDLRGPYHIALTYSQGHCRGFVNGKPAPGARAGIRLNFTLPTNSDPITLGGGLAGTLKNVRVWDHARSQAQLSAYMGAAVDRNAPGLLRQWRCSDGSGTTITDYSPAASHATMTGGAWCRIGVREIIPVELGIVQQLVAVRVGYAATTPANTSVLVQSRLTNMNGSTTFPFSYGNWATVVAGATGKTYTFGNGTFQHTARGVALQVRMRLRSDDVAATPAVTTFAAIIQHNGVTGSATVLTRSRFSRIDQIGVTAIQSGVGSGNGNQADALIEARPAVLVAKTAYGGRFSLRNSSGAPINPVIDVLVQGSRLREA